MESILVLVNFPAYIIVVFLSFVVVSLNYSCLCPIQLMLRVNLKKLSSSLREIGPSDLTFSHMALLLFSEVSLLFQELKPET